MLKQVQMTRSAGYRLQGLGSREENRQSVQGFNPTEKVVRAVCESLSLCHPGLDPGSALLRAKAGIRGLRIGAGRSNQTGLPLNGSPFSEKNGCKFLDASCEKKKENLFLMGY